MDYHFYQIAKKFPAATIDHKSSPRLMSLIPFDREWAISCSSRCCLFLTLKCCLTQFTTHVRTSRIVSLFYASPWFSFHITNLSSFRGSRWPSFVSVLIKGRGSECQHIVLPQVSSFKIRYITNSMRNVYIQVVIIIHKYFGKQVSSLSWLVTAVAGFSSNDQQTDMCWDHANQRNMQAAVWSGTRKRVQTTGTAKRNLALQYIKFTVTTDWDSLIDWNTLK